jgi:hypothetical protein
VAEVAGVGSDLQERASVTRGADAQLARGAAGIRRRLRRELGLLDLALARLREAGLVHERTTERTDSTHVLAAVRDLTRLELITEAVRAALEEVAGTSPHLLDELVDEDWGRRYGRPVRLAKNPTRPKSAPARRCRGTGCLPCSRSSRRRSGCRFLPPPRSPRDEDAATVALDADRLRERVRSCREDTWHDRTQGATRSGTSSCRHGRRRPT